ncbi:MAG: hypothetical protein MMC33_008309 [Icmadophila ericetorum]|nr:hypothetical protein [Icmadophila ericetorum]
MDALSYELIIKIFQYLPSIRDIYNLSKISSTFRYVFQHSDDLLFNAHAARGEREETRLWKRHWLMLALERDGLEIDSLEERKKTLIGAQRASLEKNLAHYALHRSEYLSTVSSAELEEVVSKLKKDRAFRQMQQLYKDLLTYPDL